MMGILRAHGLDAGPLQRPMVAGALSGLLACAPAIPLLVAFGAFEAAAEEVLRLPRASVLALLICAFTAAGALYGLAMRRAANDRAAGWLFGAVFGFIAWAAAPVLVLPLLTASRMAAGSAAIGFFLGFLLWGLVLGSVFPFVHRPLQGRLDGGGAKARTWPAIAPSRLLRRTPRKWRR